jgi:hypothetical protein
MVLFHTIDTKLDTSTKALLRFIDLCILFVPALIIEKSTS